VYQVGKDDCGESSKQRNREPSGSVAAFFFALADQGVVLLQHGGVAVPLSRFGVLNPSTRADDTVVVSHCLGDFSAEVVLAVVGAILEHLGVLHYSVFWRLVGLLLIEEGVGTVGIDIAVALPALDAVACVNEGEKKEDSG